MEYGEPSFVDQIFHEQSFREVRPRCLIPIKIWDAEESTSSEEEFCRRELRGYSYDVGKSDKSTKKSNGKDNSTNGIDSDSDIYETDGSDSVVLSMDLGGGRDRAPIVGKRRNVKKQRDVEIITISSTSSETTVQNVEDLTNSRSSMDLPTEVMRKDPESSSSSQKTEKDVNTFPVVDECLEQVVNASVKLQSISTEVLANFGINLNKYKKETSSNWPRDNEDPPESSFSKRYQVIDNYLKNAYCSSDTRMEVSDSPAKHVREASRRGNTCNNESNTKKRRKIYSSGTSNVEPAETATKCTEGEVAGPSAQKKVEDICRSSIWKTLEDFRNARKALQNSEQVVKGPTCSSDYIPLHTTEEQSSKTECEDEINSSVGTLSSSSFVPSEQGIDDITVSNSSSTVDTRMRKMKIASDFLLTNAKSVAFVVANALKSHALCMILLQLSETALDEENFTTAERKKSLATKYACLALEAAEAAVRYHKSAAKYVAEAEEPLDDVQMEEEAQDAPLWQVTEAADQLRQMGLAGTGTRSDDEVDAMARLLTPPLRLVTHSDVFTSDVVQKLNTALLHKAMAVTVAAATTYTLFVISQAENMLSLLPKSTGGGRDVGSAGIEAADTPGTAPQDENNVQSGAPPSTFADEGVRNANGKRSLQNSF